ncbi:MAG TPA: bifunctional DNA-formamidopyrimidine glycosylase/DNA-(apurinic or apyrimidinic site) lyase [Leucothrix sp.]|nr:bifunctional DNA-formamidopyrimidine glycosylase/DNA-(apurinic or apyrimidinic site) lyase [Leucothrix sp.]
MPELPEVETTCRGILPYIEQQLVAKVIVRQPKLRWAIPPEIHEMEGAIIQSVKRRGKYILLETVLQKNKHEKQVATAIIHLGMSGSLRVVDVDLPSEKHDHFDIVFDNGKVLRLRDPRRFGAVLWTRNNPLKHKLLRSLGPEPLEKDFNPDYLYQQSRGRSVSIKQFIMNAHIIVGVGNIYACESLFKAGISPKRLAGKTSSTRYQKLVLMIKDVLAQAIEQGGTTLRDFVQVEGNPGYFQQELFVYGRAGQPCRICGSLIKQIKQGQRSTFYCSKCQS